MKPVLLLRWDCIDRNLSLVGTHKALFWDLHACHSVQGSYRIDVRAVLDSYILKCCKPVHLCKIVLSIIKF